MKTFLTICICAMVSAGVYGFVDMAGDVRHGTMIQYDRGDAPSASSTSETKPATQLPITKNEISKDAANVDLATKNLASKESKKPETSEISLLDFASKSYSRGDPASYTEADDLIVKPIAFKDSTTRVGVVTPSVEIASATIAAVAEVNTDSIEKIVQEDQIDYRSFSRGNPGKKHKKKSKD